jgi:hypothetical protein
MSCVSPERDSPTTLKTNELVVWETPKHKKQQQPTGAATLYMPSMYSESDDEMEEDSRCEAVASSSQARNHKEIGGGASRYAPLRRSLAWSFSEQDERCPTEAGEPLSHRAYTDILSSALMTHNCGGVVENAVANSCLRADYDDDDDDDDEDAADAMEIARVTPVHWVAQVGSTADIRRIFCDQLLKREGICAFQE